MNDADRKNFNETGNKLDDILFKIPDIRDDLFAHKVTGTLSEAEYGYMNRLLTQAMDSILSLVVFSQVKLGSFDEKKEGTENE